MNITRLAVAVCLAAMVVSSASAELVGLVVFREEAGGPGTPPPGPERWIYRVYAEFTDPSDVLYAWGGGDFGPSQIYNITSDGVAGSGFANIPDSSLDIFSVAPHFAGTARDWDSYMTVGVLYGFDGPGGVDGTHIAPGTPGFIPAGATSWQGGGVSLGLSGFLQGRADYRVVGNDTTHRVLMMQLVVNAEEHVSGFVNVGWKQWDSSQLSFAGLTFTSIPVPAAWIVFAPLLAKPRRRS